MSSAGCAAAQGGAAASSRRRVMPSGEPRQEQRVAGGDHHVAVDIDDPVAMAADGHDAHAGGHRQLHGRDRPVGHVGTLADEDAVRDLLGHGQVDQQLCRDPELVGDHPGHVDRVVTDAFDGADHLQHRAHGFGLLGATSGQHTDPAHVPDQLGELVFELTHLLGHVGISEVHGGVGQVDHQLGRVLGLGQHGPEVAWSVVHVSHRAQGRRACWPLVPVGSGWRRDRSRGAKGSSRSSVDSSAGRPRA